MVVLGLLLVVLSGGLAAGVALSSSDPVVATAFGVSLSNVSVGELFLVGAGAGLVFGLGLIIAVAGAGRRRAQRRGRTLELRAERDRHEALAQQNAELQEQLERTGGAPVAESVAPTPLRRHAEPDQPADDAFPR